MKFFDRVKMRTATTGTGNVALGAAPTSFRTLAQAGASNGDEVPYVIQEGASFARGIGTWTQSTNTLVRDANEVRWTGGVESTAKLSLAGTAMVFIGLHAEILDSLAADAAQASSSATAAAAAELAATTKASEAAEDADNAALSAAAALASKVAAEAAADSTDLVQRFGTVSGVRAFSHSTFSHAIVDEGGNVLAYIEKASGKWRLGLSDAIELPAAAFGGVTFEALPSGSSYVGAFKDGAGNALMYFKKDGTVRLSISDDSDLPDATIAAQVDALLADLLASEVFQNGGISGPQITCLGDSLTASSGASEGSTKYPAVLATLTGLTVNNYGVGGENARTIAGRWGAWPYVVTVSGGAIPTSGAVDVSLTSIDGGAVGPLVQGSVGINPCVLAGVSGTLSLVSEQYKFTRAETGSEVPVNYPVALVTDAYNTRRGDILILDIGQNGGFEDDAQLVAMHQAIINSMTRADNRYLVLGRTTSSLSARAAVHDAFQRAFGRRFVNVLAYLSSYAALENAGITPTSGDDAAIVAGTCPPSFLSDSVHRNDPGYGQTAFIVHERLKELGWI